MSDGTKIEWTDATWNPVTGCSIVSPGCTNCYAMKMADRLGAMTPRPDGKGNPHLLHYDGTTTRGELANKPPVWTGKVKLAPEHVLLAPLRRRKPTTYFVNSMGDLFHESVPEEWIDRVFAVMALAPQHTFQVLTKRAARMRAYMEERTELLSAVHDEGGGPIVRAIIALAKAECRSVPIALSHVNPTAGRWPLHNVWLGVSAEDQRRADERVPELLATPAAVRFVSAEPLLGPIDFRGIRKFNPTGKPWVDALRGLVTRGDYLARSPSECSFNTSTSFPAELPSLDWIIVGGESGPNARPMHPAWARSIRDQCAAAGTAFFFKQWGAWAPLAKAMPVDEAGGRTCSVAWPDGTIGPGSATERGGRGTSLYIATKKLAGRLLDGVEHNAMPRVAA